MNITLVVALISLLGVGLSAGIQYSLGNRSEKRKKLIEIRSKAYTDLLTCVSGLAVSAKHNEKRSREQMQELTRVKSIIVLVGSKNVVQNFAVFF